jgi:hypothetical protein
VEARLFVFDCAGVADEADQLPGDDVYPGSDARAVAPLVCCLAVVGRWGIVVEVGEVVLVPLEVAHHDSNPGAGMVHEADDHTADGGDDRLELCCEYVRAVVEACAVGPALHPIIAERGLADHRECHRSLFPAVRELPDDLDVVGIDSRRDAR